MAQSRHSSRRIRDVQRSYRRTEATTAVSPDVWPFIVSPTVNVQFDPQAPPCQPRM